MPDLNQPDDQALPSPQQIQATRQQLSQPQTAQPQSDALPSPEQIAAMKTQKTSQTPVDPLPSASDIAAVKGQTQEKPGALSRLWDWANRGIISKDTIMKGVTAAFGAGKMDSQQVNEALSPFEGEGYWHAGLREFTRGAFNDVANLASGLTSPLSLATLGFGEIGAAAGASTKEIAALRAVKSAEAAETASQVAYTARTTEVARATQQAEQAVQAARVAEASETAGNGSRAATIAAQNTASEAVANMNKAKQALQEAEAASGEAKVATGKAVFAHQEAVKAAAQAGALGNVPGQVGSVVRPVARTLGPIMWAGGMSQALTPRQPGETPEDEIERRLMGLGFATLAAEGFKGSKMDVPLSEVPARAVDLGESGVELAKKAAQKTKDLVSGSLGISQDFDTVIKNISKPSAKQYQQYVTKIENVSDDLKAILNANKDIDDPDGFATAIDRHIKQQENALQNQAGAQKNSPQPVTPDIMQRVQDRLDKFFDENRAAYGSDTDVAEAKKKLLERVLQTRNGQQMQAPNLFEAENIRWALGNEGKPQFATNAIPTTNAYKAGALEVADVLRKAIDDSYQAKGVDGVAEWRAKEANLIDIRDRLKLAQAKADALGQPGIWKSLFAKVGTPSAIIAAAFGHPIGAGMLAAGITGDYIHQLATNPNSLVQRAGKLAAREPEAQTTQPTTSPWVSPAAPAAPTQLGPVPAGGQTPTVTPVSGEPAAEGMPESRENTQLHGMLATHYGKSVKGTNYADLEARFLNDVRVKEENKVALDAAEKTLLGKVNETEISDLEKIKKAQEKAAKEQEKIIQKGQEKNPPINVAGGKTGIQQAQVEAEGKTGEELPKTSIEKLKEYAAEAPNFFKDLSFEKTPASSGSIGQLNYQGKPFAYLGIPLGEFESELGPVKKILGKAAGALTKGQDADAAATFKALTGVPQAYEIPSGALLPSEENSIWTPEHTARHELGHVLAGHLNGFEVSEIGSHLHPDNPTGAAAASFFDFSSIGDKDGKITRQSLGNRLPNMIETLMGGAASDELHSNQSRYNEGTTSDRQMAFILLKHLGFSDGEAVQIMEAATDRIKEKLNHPVTKQILQENVATREEGLPDTHLYSQERLNSIRAEHDRRMAEYGESEKANNRRGNRQGDAGGTGLETRGQAEGGRPAAERVSAAQTAVLTPAEKSTGNPEFDKTIKTAGATPGGIQKGVEGIVPDQVLFHDPETGSTLAVPADDVTEDRIKQVMTESRKKFGVAQSQAKPVSDELVKKFGTTDDGLKAGFILSDGRMVPLQTEHNQMLKQIGAGDRVDFLNDEKAIRTRYRTGRGGKELVFSVPESGVSEEQLLQMRKSIGQMGRNGNAVMEIARPGGKSTQKEFVRPSDIDSMLQEIGAHPETSQTDWAQRAEQQAKESGGGFTIDPRTGQTPDSGYMIEASPESRQVLDHSATAEDIRKFYDAHKALFDQHPNLHVGGYQNELNISANVPNLEAAKQVAGKLDQRSIWDVKNQKEIDTGGKGEQTSFPGYNLDTRLAELNRTSDQQKGLISTRLPSSKKSTENPITQDLTVGRDAIEQMPGMADKMAKLVRKYPGFKVPENIKDPVKVLDRFVTHVKENLKQLYNQVPPETQAANSKWYDSANGLARRLSEKYGTTLNQMAGAIAAMSPQKDWDQNVSLANRVNDIYHTQQDTVTTPDMLDKSVELASRKTGKSFKPMEKALAGKKLSDLTKPIQKAAWVRLFDEVNNPREYESIDPATGEPRGVARTAAGEKQKVAWGGLNEISKALNILQDGSRENISENLGKAHKVRNFYNNIVDPNNPRGDVTIDTHAVAAGLTRPLGGNSTEVLHNFGAGGAPGSVINGLNGTYPLYADAYREAARELGIQPRQLQSVVWEHVRNIFPGEIKRQPSLVDAVNKTWKDYADRKISLDKTHEAVRELANQATSALQTKRSGGKVTAEDFIKMMSQGGLNALGGEK